MSGVLIAIFGYVAIQFAIGAYVSRRMASASDYILAGRQLGVALVTFSVFASFFGAEALIASAGAVYESGPAGAVVEPFGYGGAIILSGLIVAAPLWRRNLTTLADLFQRRFSPTVEKLVVIVLLPGSLFWAAAQIRAFGQVLVTYSSFDLATAITIAALLIATYSVVGGLLADSITDVIQGLVLIAGLVILAILVLAVPVPYPGAPVTAAVGAAAATGPPEPPPGWLDYAEMLLVPICGTAVSVELISRYLGSRSAFVAALATVAGGAAYIIVGLIPIALGLAARELLPDLEEPEQVVAKLAEAVLPGPLVIVFVGAIVSAILSVTHAALHGASAQVSHNIVTPLTPHHTPRQRLWTARATVFMLSLVAFALSLTSDRIKDLVEYASAVGSAGVFVALMFGLFTGFGRAWAAAGAVVTGAVVWPVAKFVLELDHAYLAALVAAGAVYVVIALLESTTGGPRPSPSLSEAG